MLQFPRLRVVSNFGKKRASKILMRAQDLEEMQRERSYPVSGAPLLIYFFAKIRDWSPSNSFAKPKTSFLLVYLIIKFKFKFSLFHTIYIISSQIQIKTLTDSPHQLVK